jgi:protocatechuate 3,4-dioxygenase beta subunit
LRSHDAPLAETMRVLDERRRILRAIAGAGAFALVPKDLLACTLIPEETAGPYPGDGTNGPNVLAESGIVRSDIRSSFGASSGTAPGTVSTLTLSLVSTTSGCAQPGGLAVYVWHCDADGRYSMYSPGVTDQNFLRGVQLAGANGQATFTTVFPGCYAGRWPHIHFEIYASLDAATNGANALRTSQLALPQSVCEQVYAQTSLYPESAPNLSQISLDQDMVFGDDDAEYQMATVTGDNANGYAISLEVGIAVDAETNDLVFVDGFD